MTRTLARPLYDAVWTRILRHSALNAATGCRVWTGALSKKRRGQRRPAMKIGGRVRSVARVVCEMRWGPPPSPLHEAGHVCPYGEAHRCVNPYHLQWMTREANERYKQERSLWQS